MKNKTYVTEYTTTSGEKLREKWSTERIKKAFNFGNGTEKNFLQYIENNKRQIKII